MTVKQEYTTETMLIKVSHLIEYTLRSVLTTEIHLTFDNVQILLYVK